MKATRQFMSLCLVIGMTIGGNNSTVIAQGADYARTASYTTHSISSTSSYPQNEIRGLTIGDKVPDIEINSIINYPTTKANISDFKGKLLIIDFWGTTCSNCIRVLPRFDSLQHMYKDGVQMLTVTNFDTKEKVQKTLQRYSKTKNISLPIILYGDILKKYFPHEFVSHVIWIDGNGIVKAITGSDYVTGKNIETILAGEPVNWPVKKDIPDFNYDKPILNFSQEAIASPEFVFYSSFTGCIDGIDGTDRLSVDSVKQTITYNFFNKTLLQLCDGALAGSGTGYIPVDKLVLQVKDTGRYIRGNQFWETWKKKNTYCYSLTIPLNISDKEKRSMIKNDLTHWLYMLGISVKLEGGIYIISEKGYDPLAKRQQQ